jgi:hypothetical protein
MMSTVTINGVVIQTSGRGNITIHGGHITVDGKDVTPDAKEISIVVNGSLASLEVDSCDKVSVTGDVGKVSTISGRVDISGNVAGSVSTVSGRVDCGNISGSVSTVSGRIDRN